MNGRDTILPHVRKALAAKTCESVRGAEEPMPDAEAFRAWLPAVGRDYKSHKRLFAEHATALRTDFRVVADREAMLDEITRLAKAEGWKKVGSHGGALTDAASNATALPICRTDDGYDVGDLESCDAGISACEALIAQTGSVLITSRSSGGRALSILPPHHVVLAKREQMLPDMVAGYAMLREKYGGTYPSLVSFITGPSRTGDVERILVLGAHGPKKLTVLLMES